MLSVSSKYSRHEQSKNEYTLQTTLVIHDFQPQDSGVYKCVAKNAMNGNGDRVEGVVYVHNVQGKGGCTAKSRFVEQQ